MRDQNATVRKTGATAAGTTYTSAIDTKAPDGIGNLTGKVKLFLAVNAIAGLSDDKTVTFTLQDSANGTDFTDVSGVASAVFTGASSAGAGAATHYREWIPTLRRYLRIKEVVAATPGSIVAYTYDFGVELGAPAGL